MKAHTLCMIVPDRALLPELREQVRGLIVTTVCRVSVDHWDVAPTPVIILSIDALDEAGNVIRQGEPTPMYVPETWLRPIDGTPRSDHALGAMSPRPQVEHMR